MTTDKIRELIVSYDTSIIEAMKQMDKVNKKILFIFKGEVFLSILTIGDIQRAIIAGMTLDETVYSIPLTNKVYATPEESISCIRDKMARLRTDYMPVIDAKGNLVDVILWKDIMDSTPEVHRETICIPVVIMAGGEGTRLRPITNVIPKPLIPLGEKTILEAIMDQFTEIGCDKFYISVNYKQDMISYYMEQLPRSYDIEYLKEDKPLGTIGSISLLKGKIKTPFFVSNCDALINQDYRDVYEYHKANNNDMTIVTALKTYSVPYGVVETTEGGVLAGIQEKPKITYQINTGVYILEPKVIDEIPQDELFHTTHLIEKIRSKGGKIGCFPVSDGSWIDIGEWDKYLKTINVKQE